MRREAAEREHFFRYISEREQRLLDLLGQRRKSWEVVQVGLLLFDLLPRSQSGCSLAKRRQLDRPPAVPSAGRRRLWSRARVIPCPILHPHDGWVVCSSTRARKAMDAAEFRRPSCP